MNINPINNISNNINIRGTKPTGNVPQKEDYPDNKLVKELDKMSMMNNVNISKKDYKLNLSREELEKRTHKRS